MQPVRSSHSTLSAGIGLSDDEPTRPVWVSSTGQPLHPDMARHCRYRHFVSLGSALAGAADTIDEQVHLWLTASGYTVTPDCDNGLGQIAPGIWYARLREHATDGPSTVVHTVLGVDHSGHRHLIAQVTIHSPITSGTSGPLWVWVESDRRDRQGTAARELLHRFTQTLPVFDSIQPLTPRPQLVGQGRVEQVLDALCDTQRRGLTFVAAYDGTAGIPVLKWSDCVAGILSHTAGLACAYVLDTDATARFNAQVPDSHKVEPFTIRTFDPAVVFDDPADGQRHPVLSTSTITNYEQPTDDASADSVDPEAPDAWARNLRDMLAHRARHISGRHPLPTTVGMLDRRLGVRLEELLANPCPAAAPRTAAAESAQAVEPDRQLQTLRRKLNDSRRHSYDLQQQLDTVRQDNAELRERLDDEMLETAAVADDLAAAEHQLRHLRNLLTSLGHAEAADTVLDNHAADAIPESFTDLLARMHELPRIVFTGDPQLAYSLDECNPTGTWAGTAWRALQALSDYAQLSVEGNFPGDVDTYLLHTPSGQHGFSARRHARDETDEVANCGKFRRPRTLPVPVGVDPTGKVFMAPHFRIAHSGTVSPRMHYFDDTARTGRIYIGYLGRHLPSGRTN